MGSPSIQELQARMDRIMSFGITPSAEIMRLQDELNRRAAAEERTADLQTLTYDTAMADAHDALVGLAADLSGTTERTSLMDMVTHDGRMRGLGILLIAVAMVGLVVDYIMLHTA